MKKAAIFLLLALSSCSSSPPKCLVGSPGSLLCATTERAPREDAARQEEQCEDLGFKPGTDAFANCRLKIIEMEHSEAVANTAKRGQ